MAYLDQILFTKLFCEKEKIKNQPVISPLDKEDLVYFLTNDNLEILINYFIAKYLSISI